MKKQYYLWVLLLFPFGLFAQVTNYEIGDVVDDFTVVDTNGDLHNLYNITSQGYYVYIDFFFDTCPPCQLTQATFNEFYDTFGCNQGEVYMLTINNGSDTNAEVIAYEEEFGGPFNHAPAVGIEGGCLDVDLDFGIAGYPSFVLISPANEFLHRIDQLPNTVDDFIATFPTGFDPQPLVCSPLGVVENEIAIRFQIVPNPSSSSKVTIYLEDATIPTKLVIYSILGQEVYTGTISETMHSIDLLLSGGSYFVTLASAEKYGVRQLIIK